jgi:hypothetical protein
MVPMTKHFFSIAVAAGLTAGVSIGSLCPAVEPASTTATTPSGFGELMRDLLPEVAARLDWPPKHYRQIEPSLQHLAGRHADRVMQLSREQQVDLLVKLAGFIDAKREATGDMVVVGPGRGMIGLLDPVRGLEPKEITALATGYGTTATIFKQTEADQTIRQVADAFLEAVGQAATAGAPTTIVVLGHGAPEEIQSYSISFERLAASLIDGAASRGSAKRVDLGQITLICDDCYSADFLINLGNALEKECRTRRLALDSLPVCIAGTNRDCVGHADFGEKFVPHFWKDVIELFYVRQPRPQQITLRDFFEKVDNMMYGYGRAPSVDRDGAVSYRLVDPKLCQDPVVFVPLDEKDLALLREILALPADAPLPRLLDIG